MLLARVRMTIDAEARPTVAGFAHTRYSDNHGSCPVGVGRKKVASQGPRPRCGHAVIGQCAPMSPDAATPTRRWVPAPRERRARCRRGP
jgi:hypothetical protein